MSKLFTLTALSFSLSAAACAAIDPGTGTTGGDQGGDMTGAGGMMPGVVAQPGVEGTGGATADPSAMPGVTGAGGTTVITPGVTPVTGSGGTTQVIDNGGSGGATMMNTPGCTAIAGSTMLHDLETPYSPENKHWVDPGSGVSGGFIWGGHGSYTPPTFDYITGEGCDGSGAAGGVAPSGGWLILSNFGKDAAASLTAQGFTGIGFAARNPGTQIIVEAAATDGTISSVSLSPSDDFVTHQVTFAELGMTGKEIATIQWKWNGSGTLYLDNLVGY